MLKYARWYEVRVYKKLLTSQVLSRETTDTKLVTCDGWFLFGVIPIIRRINI